MLRPYQVRRTYSCALAPTPPKNFPAGPHLVTFSCVRFSRQETAIRRRPRMLISPPSCTFAASRCGRGCSIGRAGCRGITRHIATNSAKFGAGWLSWRRSRSRAPAMTVPGCRPASARGVRRPALLHGRWLVDERDHLFGKTLHFLELRAELQEQEIDARLLERANTIGDLLRCSRESRLQPAI